MVIADFDDCQWILPCGLASECGIRNLRGRNRLWVFPGIFQGYGKPSGGKFCLSFLEAPNRTVLASAQDPQIFPLPQMQDHFAGSQRKGKNQHFLPLLRRKIHQENVMR